MFKIDISYLRLVLEDYLYLAFADNGDDEVAVAVFQRITYEIVKYSHKHTLI